MYDAFSSDYDRFVSWPGRLAYEMPFLIEQARLSAQPGQPCRVLDTACGTGMHAIELARQGAAPVGTDLSVGMIAQARQNSAAAGVDIPFFVSGFTDLGTAIPAARMPFDLLTCLGNSLPHVESLEELDRALRAFRNCLRPGGRLVIQSRNFDAVMAQRSRWMEPQAHREGKAEWVFVRFYDFQDDGSILLHILTLKRTEGEAWRQSVTTTRLLPLRQEDLAAALRKAGFEGIERYGDLAGTRFEEERSGNLVVTALKPETEPSGQG
jgi:SAM-dependent methyltransferase